MAETRRNIEDIIRGFYNNFKNFSAKNEEVYYPIDSGSGRNEDYFKVGMISHREPLGTRNSYVKSKFDEIVQMYYSSGIEELSKNPDNYIATKISNNIWRRRINIRTPEGELDIRAYRPFWKWFEVILPFPIILFLRHRLKARFRHFHTDIK